MAYKLEKPYSSTQKAHFVIEYNHKMLLKIEETKDAIYALEADEILSGNRVIKNPDYEKELIRRNNEQRIDEIKKELEELDKKSIRSIRANEHGYIEQYENQAQELREELSILESEATNDNNTNCKPV